MCLKGALGCRSIRAARTQEVHKAVVLVFIFREECTNRENERLREAVSACVRSGISAKLANDYFPEENYSLLVGNEYTWLPLSSETLHLHGGHVLEVVVNSCNEQASV